jgi:hypothetical protein
MPKEDDLPGISSCVLKTLRKGQDTPLRRGNDGEDILYKLLEFCQIHAPAHLVGLDGVYRLLRRVLVRLANVDSDANNRRKGG